MGFKSGRAGVIASGGGNVVGPATSTAGGFARYADTTGKLLVDSAATISNADVNAAAAIAYSKLASLTSANILVGSVGNVATVTAVTGAISISNTGVTAYVGIVPLAQGGTNNANAAVNGGIAYSSAAAILISAAGTAEQALLSAGAAAPVFSTISSPSEIANLGITATVAANALTITITDAAGSTPSATSKIKIGMLNATLATGTYAQVLGTAAQSLVVPAAATLGSLSASAYTYYIYEINNAGTLEPAISMSPFNENNLITTVAISAAATSNRTMYSTTARTSVAFRMVGKIVITQTGTNWTANPTAIRLGDHASLTRDAKIFLHVQGATSNAAGADTVVPFNAPTSATDPLNCWNGSNQFVVPIPCKVTVLGCLRINTGTAAVVNQACLSYIKVNATTVAQGFKFVESTGVASWSAGQISYVYFAAAGDTIQLNAETTVTSPQLGTGNVDTYLNITCDLY